MTREHARKTAYAAARELWPHPADISVWVAPGAKVLPRYRFRVFLGAKGTITSAAQSWDALVAEMRRLAVQEGGRS